MIRLGNRLSLLSKPSFCWFLLSTALTSIGSGLSYIALSWGILGLNDSVAAVSILMLCFWIPNIFFGPLLGVIADVWSRQWLLFSANSLRGLVLILFGVLFHYYTSSALIYLLMGVLGLCLSVSMPAGTALIREIVTSDQLLYANSMLNIVFEASFAIGMALVGLIIVLIGVPNTLIVTGAIFFCSTIAIMFVRVPQTNPVSVNLLFRLIDDFISGISYLMHHKKLIVIYCVQLLLLVIFMTTPVLLAPFAKNILHASVAQFGRIEAALSIGIVCGGIFAPWVAKRLGLYRSFIFLSLSLVIFFVWFAVNRHVIGAELLYFLIGIGLSVWPLIITRAQELTILDFQARVQAVFNSISGIFVLAVYLLMNLTSRFFPVSWLYVFEVLVALIAIIVLWRYQAIIEE